MAAEGIERLCRVAWISPTLTLNLLLSSTSSGRPGYSRLPAAASRYVQRFLKALHVAGRRSCRPHRPAAGERQSADAGRQHLVEARRQYTDAPTASRWSAQ